MARASVSPANFIYVDSMPILGVRDMELLIRLELQKLTLGSLDRPLEI